MGELAYSSPTYCSALLQRLKQLYDKGQLCDFTLVADNVEVKLHSIVLFSASAYFKTMMDKGSLEERHFCLQEGSLESLQTLVDFMYTGCLMLSEKNVFIVLQLANALSIPEAAELCEQFLQDIAKEKDSRNLDSVIARLKADTESVPGITIKEEVVDDFEMDQCNSFEEDKQWNDGCYFDYKSSRVRRKSRRAISYTGVAHQRYQPKYQSRQVQKKNNHHLLSREEKRKKHRGRQRKNPKIRKKDNLFHTCTVCGRNFRWHSAVLLHQKSHWSVIYRNIVVNHIVFQSRRLGLQQGYKSVCTLCHKSFAYHSQYKAHLLTVHKSKVYKYRCVQCQRRTFLHKKHLSIHCIMHHSEKTKLKLSKCCLCSRIFLFKGSLVRHKSSVHQVNRCVSDTRTPIRLRKHEQRARSQTKSAVTGGAKWTCEEKNCSSSFTSKNKLINHMAVVHPQVNYNCPLDKCKFSTRVKVILDRHCKKYHDDSCNNVCGICAKTFQRVFRLKIHMFSRHRILDPELTVYDCPVEGCCYSTVLKDGVKKHMKKHQPEKPFTCEMCGKHFKTEKSVEKHKGKVHLGIRNYICDVCGASYGDESELKIHLVRHSDTKTYSCQHCDYATFDKGNYKTHLYGKHGIKLEEHMKIFECKLCRFSTSIKYQYSDHMRVHYQIRDIPCPHCSKKFITRKSMRSHVVKCHNPKDYHCTLCSYSSADKSKVKEHIRVMHTHRNFKPFKCPYCSFQCATGGNCRKHVKQRHKGEEVRYIKLPLADPLAGSTSPLCFELASGGGGGGGLQAVRMADLSDGKSDQNGCEMPDLVALHPPAEVTGLDEPPVEPRHPTVVQQQGQPPEMLSLALPQTLGAEALDPRLTLQPTMLQTLNIPVSANYDGQTMQWTGLGSIMQQHQMNM